MALIRRRAAVSGSGNAGRRVPDSTTRGREEALSPYDDRPGAIPMQKPNQIVKFADDARTRITEVSVDEAVAMVASGACVIDVRSEAEFRAQHLPDAVNIGWEVIATKIHALVPDTSKPLLCYCAVGHRSAIAADILQNLGYRHVVSLRGGLAAYRPTPAVRACA